MRHEIRDVHSRKQAIKVVANSVSMADSHR
jgi:hypothetical protein